jgi:hypothetical protein
LKNDFKLFENKIVYGNDANKAAVMAMLELARNLNKKPLGPVNSDWLNKNLAL